MTNVKDLPAGQAKPDQPRYHVDLPTSLYVNQAVEYATVKGSSVTAVINPNRQCSVNLPIMRDSGEVELMSAHLVQHSNLRGPFKGGLIYHPAVTLPGMASLAALNTWKAALIDVPFGGAKAGVACDPRLLSERELQKVTRKLVTALQDLLGPTLCIPAPDIGTDERTMAWVFDQYSQLKGFSPGVVSGKPIWLHGCAGRDKAPAMGAAIATREFLRGTLRTRVAGTKFIVQGFGKLGSTLAEQLMSQGGIIIGISSSETAVFNEKGLDVTALKDHTARGLYLAEFPGGEAVANDETFLEIPCDVAIPAAVAGTVNAQTVNRLNCKAVVEAANAGLTPEASQVLADKGIPVCPDLLVASGGLVASFMEWTQNQTNYAWSPEEVQQKLDRKIVDAYTEMQRVAKARKLSLRTAAYVIALNRVEVADAQRGHGQVQVQDGQR